jgi:uncharacterized protein YkwD
VIAPTVVRPFVVVLALVLALAAGTAAPPAPAAAATATSATMASQVMTWLNRDRVAAGLVPIRAWPALASVATTRAARMAASGTLSHAAAGGSVGAALTAAGIQWYSFGEMIGVSGYPWGSQAAANLYAMWKSSPAHHAIMFSATYNYADAGFVRRSDGSTWASIVFTESVDHTAPSAHNGTIARSGTTVSFYWSGRDVRLQTHTAGLRSFDVQYRVDGGSWRLIRNDTTSTGLRLYSRPHGHYYSFRAQAADRRGNLSRWTAAIRIWVP